MSKLKPVQKVCPEHGPVGRTRKTNCEICQRPLSIHREPNGKPQRDPILEEKLEPTPEQKKKRKAGIHDLMIDTLFARKLVTDIQVEAYATFCRARETYYGKTTAAIGGYGNETGGQSEGPPDDVLVRAKATHTIGLDALDCAGAGPKAALLHLYFHNEALHVHNLLIGLDALVGAYRTGDKKPA
jgi:hypothetical protein